MSDVKRYDMSGECERDEMWMAVDATGEWVRYDDYAALRARLAEVEKRAYKLAVAIMGGEDAPGYADSIDTDVLVGQIKKERMQHSEWTDACVKAALATARRDALEEAARWHDGKAATIGHIMVKQTREEEMHRTYAAAIRALIDKDATP